MCFTQNTPKTVCLTGNRIHVWLKIQVSKTKALICLSLRRWMSWKEMMHLRQHDSHVKSLLYGDWCNFSLLWSRMRLYNTWQGHKPEQHSSPFPGVSAPPVLFPSVSNTFSRLCSILCFSTLSLWLTWCLYSPWENFVFEINYHHILV